MGVVKLTEYKGIPVYHDPTLKSAEITACWSPVERGYEGLCYLNHTTGKLELPDGSPIPAKKDNRHKVSWFVVSTIEPEKITKLCEAFEQEKQLIK